MQNKNTNRQKRRKKREKPSQCHGDINTKGTKKKSQLEKENYLYLRHS